LFVAHLGADFFWHMNWSIASGGTSVNPALARKRGTD
jgi:hypothetical protein